MAMRPLYREFSPAAHTRSETHARRMCIGLLVILSSIPLARTQLQCPAGSVRSVDPGGGIQPTSIANTDAEYLEFRYTKDTYGRGQSEFDLTIAETTTCDVLIVGGGGSGGASIGGGGGAGGVVYIEEVELRSGTYTVLVGRGGAAVDSDVEIWNYPPYVTRNWEVKASGGESVFIIPQLQCAKEQQGSLNQGKDGKSSMITLSGSVVRVSHKIKDIKLEGKGGGGALL